jgi:hypothetical protein
MRIDMSVKFDLQTGRVQWSLKTVDDATGDFPVDALAGFLPPEDGPGRGQGYVTFSIKPKPGIAAGSTVKNTASITFDVNDPIVTNEVSNVVGDAADIVLLVSSSPSVDAGQQTTIQFTVINDGPQTAQDTRFTLSLLQGGTLIRLTADEGDCSGSQCQLGNLAVGSQVNIVAELESGSEIALSITGETISSVLEINPVDKRRDVQVTVIPSSGFSIFLPTVQK